MNEIPQSGPEREAYIISVMQGVKREGDRIVNLQVRNRFVATSTFDKTEHPLWNWDNFDYRLYEPEVVRYASGYDWGVGNFHESISKCKKVENPGCTHYVKRTTGGGRTIPEYEPITLERGE